MEIIILSGCSLNLGLPVHYSVRTFVDLVLHWCWFLHMKLCHIPCPHKQVLLENYYTTCSDLNQFSHYCLMLTDPYFGGTISECELCTLGVV